MSSVWSCAGTGLNRRWYRWATSATGDAVGTRARIQIPLDQQHGLERVGFCGGRGQLEPLRAVTSGGIRGVREILGAEANVMIHIDRGGDAPTAHGFSQESRQSTRKAMSPISSATMRSINLNTSTGLSAGPSSRSKQKMRQAQMNT